MLSPIILSWVTFAYGAAFICFILSWMLRRDGARTLGDVIVVVSFAAHLAAVVLRANVPTAVASTLVTNPVTFAPIYIFAHHLGSALLDEPDTTAAEAALRPAVDRETGWWRTAWENILGLGKPLLLGLSILAVTGGLLTYGAIMLFWRLKTTWSWKRRRKEVPLGR
jgi:hypothetical protein